MANEIAISDETVDEMTEDAINAIAKIVQDRIGQTDGGIASIHFADDDKRAAVREIIVEYLKVEEAYQDREA